MGASGNRTRREDPKAMNYRFAFVSLYASVLTLLLSGAGCAVVLIATSREGTDVCAVKPQATREDVEKILGSCLRQWESKSGIRYCKYEYDGGYSGSLGGAAAFAAIDILSLGMTEAVVATSGTDAATVVGGKIGRIIVSYDNDDTVLGVFEEFAVLPDDGRSSDKDADVKAR